MENFSRKLIDWYRENGRDLPWRRTKNPYLIWISEIILQQTRVAQGYDYYQRFVTRFPDVFALAAADEDEVMKYWQGLGYYSRARNLHAAARRMAEAGGFPVTYTGVRALKGVGHTLWWMVMCTGCCLAGWALILPLIRRKERNCLSGLPMSCWTVSVPVSITRLSWILELCSVLRWRPTACFVR